MKNHVKLIMAFLVSTLILLGCGQTETPDETTNANEQAVNIVISTDNGEEVISDETIEIEENEILMDVLEENYEIEDVDGFITSIDGVEQTDDKFWLYEVNDEEALVGANEYELSSGDEVVFDLHGME
ncbi:DUF4430 domain-containing protein [Paraliobacillus sediminis]|uniref:DUF4430 domain-containing protein n=1 Tax=Paraliobacillus sediminis TaxID=1885916 RepID=UPI001F0856D6|nr:DUF4430 domain-containing protein [Paraliobacillus sediminis]